MLIECFKSRTICWAARIICTLGKLVGGVCKYIFDVSLPLNTYLSIKTNGYLITSIMTVQLTVFSFLVYTYYVIMMLVLQILTHDTPTLYHTQ